MGKLGIKKLYQTFPMPSSLNLHRNARESEAMKVGIWPNMVDDTEDMCEALVEAMNKETAAYATPYTPDVTTCTFGKAYQLPVPTHKMSVFSI